MAQLVLPLATSPALGREDFIVSPGNREAVAYLDAWPNWPGPVAVLHGPPGSGKSHLARIWAGRTGAQIVDAGRLDESILQRSGAVAVEDAGEGAYDPLLFSLIESGRPVLFTARLPPAEWKASMPDLASRYRALLSFALWAPDDELLAALARKLFADRQLQVPDTAIVQMINSLERSPAAIRDFVAHADEIALSRKRPVSVSLVRELLGDVP
ncbi:MAG TPA: AAA family ATPase [Rhizomicrobium sp.]|nr:AAA family ATPase [Rhizomicrobium sp.]